MAKIGIFDSGFGGLTIMRSIVDALPSYDYIYLGDTARAPYGSRPHETIHAFTSEALLFLFEQGCDLVILACNSASAEALRAIQGHLLPAHFPGRNVLGVIVPTAEHVAQTTTNRTVGILATESTVASGAFVREITKIDPEITVIQNPAPLLVPLIEHGAYESHAAEEIIRDYVAPLIERKVDTIVLGCTHYSILWDMIRRAVPREIAIIAEGPVVAASLRDYLIRHPEISTRLSRESTRTFYTTDTPHHFHERGSLFYGTPFTAHNTTLTDSLP